MCYEEEKSGVSVAEALGQVKVGDKIRILRTGNDNDGEDRAGWEYHLFEKGQIVEVVNVSTLPEYVIAKGVSRSSGCFDTITTQGIHPLDFELVQDSEEASTEASDSDFKFKVGDRVATKNGKGTIVFITDKEWEQYLVEHDDWFDGHSGNANFIEGAPELDEPNGWYYFEDELELLAPTETSGEEIRPSASIGDKVRVLTDGETSVSNGTTLVGWHTYKKGDIVEVVGPDSDDAIAPITVKRPNAGSWQTQTLYRDDYEKVEDSQPAEASDLLEPKDLQALMALSDLPADLLEPRDLQVLMALLALMPSLIGIPQEPTMVNRMVTSLQYILKDYQRYLATDGEINPALKAYLAS